MRRILPLLVALPLAVSAEVAHFVPPPRSAVLLHIPFATTGCIASGTAMGTRNEIVTVVRASSATILIGGTETTCTANQLRVNESGALIEPLRTNSYLDSDSPAAQSITLTTGDWRMWIRGTGSIAYSAGTVTATGLPCAVSAAAPCSINVTVGGTMAAASPSGTVTFAQVEKGSYPTSAIHTTGSPGQRNADVVTVANPLIADSWCVRGTYTAITGGVWPPPVSTALWQIGSYASANSAGLYVPATGKLNTALYDASGVSKSGTSTATVTGTTDWAVCWSGGVPVLYANGTSVALTTGGAGSGLLGVFGTITIGGAANFTPVQMGGYVKSFRVCRLSNLGRCQ